MARFIAQLILLPVRIDLYKAKAYVAIGDFFHRCAEKILSQYDQ